MTDTKKRDLLATHARSLIMDTQDSVFLTGKAGTGKSTLLRECLENTSKRVIVLASTGIAAMHIHGQTVHSFFRLGHHVSPDTIQPLTGNNAEALYYADMVVIDEVSMIRADVLDAVDAVMRESLDIPAPFGGKQMIWVGDVYQLPPVVARGEAPLFRQRYDSAYFFASHAYQEACPHVVSLQQVHRQEDVRFVQVLNRMRLGLQSTEDIALIQQCVDPQAAHDPQVLVLTTTNKSSDQHNMKQLQSLDTPCITLTSSSTGKVPPHMHPAPEELVCAPGARIMMLKNSADGYRNGSLGEIIDINEQEAVVCIEDEEYTITPHTRSVTKNYYDETIKEIVPETVGSFRQFPFKLAWAMTIHKSQGLTFDRVHIDMTVPAFAQGQAYVALSRVKSLDGLTLQVPVQAQHIQAHPAVLAYMHEALWEQTLRLAHTARERGQPLMCLYKDPQLGIRSVVGTVLEAGEISHQGHTCPGIILENQEGVVPMSYGRIYEVQILS